MKWYELRLEVVECTMEKDVGEIEIGTMMSMDAEADALEAFVRVMKLPTLSEIANDYTLSWEGGYRRGRK